MSPAPLPTPLGPAADIDGVLTRLDRLATSLPVTDGIARFNHLYVAVTTAVRDAADAGTFADGAFIERLDVVFANLFFSAIDAYSIDASTTPRAWLPLFEARDAASIAPLQFALAGMNAHINRDLMVALAATCAERGVVPSDEGVLHGDYARVNPLIQREEALLKVEYLPPTLAAIDRVTGKIDDVVAMWSIEEARRAAWSHAKTLWSLRADAAAQASFIDAIDGLVGLASRGLLRV
ncbi:MAG: DUF5995 family protein [Polyangiales bacterium]